MSEKRLEGICKEIDYKISRDEPVLPYHILPAQGINDKHPQWNTYHNFVENYTGLSEDRHEAYHKAKAFQFDDIDLERVAWNSLGGALALSFALPDESIGGIVGAGVGCLYTLYDEATKKVMGFGPVAWSMFFGGLVGSIVDPVDTNLAVYIGAAIGGLGATLREFSHARGVEPRYSGRVKKQLALVDDRFEEQSRLLISNTAETLARNN